MESSTTVPNHHGDHPGFSGPRGLLAAVSFLFGRDEAADLAIQLTGLRSGDRLVDIGCGPGVAARRARTLGAEVVGVDPAPVMLRVARLRWRGSGIDWRTGTAETLPVDAGDADVIWSLATVHHWADLDAGLDAVWRALDAGGRFLAVERKIADPHADGVASHGWTVAQAETFASTCRDRGFVDVETGVHEGSPTVVSVLARRPE